MKNEKPFDIKAASNHFATHLNFILDKRGKKVVYSDASKAVIQNLVQYFCGVPGELDLRKGIYLFGPVGSGKSTLIEAFKQWTIKVNPFRIVNCRDIQWQFSKDGAQVLEKYGRDSYEYQYHKIRNFNKPPIVYCFDDFGAENRTKHFGNDTNVMEEILQDRYIQMQEKGMITHITSNFGKNWDTIEEIYGTRVRSRSREMFNLVELDGPDLRT